MEDIIVKGKLDVKTFFNISLLIYFKTRTIIMIIVYFVLIQGLVFWNSGFDWATEIMVVVMFLIIYAGLVPLFVYISARKRSKVSPVFLETTVFTLNEDKIEVKADTVSAINNWKYVLKCIEREKYFLLMLSARVFYYLPKDGFESTAEIASFKNLVKEKGIKMKYH
jgi:hypothetical protein